MSGLRQLNKLRIDRGNLPSELIPILSALLIFKGAVLPYFLRLQSAFNLHAEEIADRRFKYFFQ